MKDETQETADFRPKRTLYIHDKKSKEDIASPDNPYYNKEKADSEAIVLCIGGKAITYELSCWLQDRNLIPDARLNSLKGEEHGRRLVRDNHQFLTDYFFHKNRTKDYPEDFLKGRETDGTQTKSEAVRFKLVTTTPPSSSRFLKDSGFSDSFDSILRNFISFSFPRNLSVTRFP